jgi:hypothetical protein
MISQPSQKKIRMMFPSCFNGENWEKLVVFEDFPCFRRYYWLNFHYLLISNLTQSQGYIVLNRPWAFVQWLQKTDIKEEYETLKSPASVTS